MLGSRQIQTAATAAAINTTTAAGRRRQTPPPRLSPPPTTTPPTPTWSPTPPLLNPLSFVRTGHSRLAFDLCEEPRGDCRAAQNQQRANDRGEPNERVRSYRGFKNQRRSLEPVPGPRSGSGSGPGPRSCSCSVSCPCREGPLEAGHFRGPDVLVQREVGRERMGPPLNTAPPRTPEAQHPEAQRSRPPRDTRGRAAPEGPAAPTPGRLFCCA